MIHKPFRLFARIAILAGIIFISFACSSVNNPTPPVSAGASATTQKHAASVKHGDRTYVSGNQGTFSSNGSNFNGTKIAGGDYIWFNAVLAAKNLGAGPTSIYVIGQSITFSSGGTDYYIPVPDAEITFDPAATTATTTFDPLGNIWYTTVPMKGLSGNQFLSGVPFQVPVGGLAGGANPVTWSGTFYSSNGTATMQWQWAAAAYTNFSSNPLDLGVKAADNNNFAPYENSDHAGSPENFLKSLTGGARGGGGSNYTGSYSGTVSLVPGIWFLQPE